MQRRCREEVKVTPKKEKHALRAVPQFTLQGSLQLTPVHSSFSFQSTVQSFQFHSVPITIRSTVQSIQFRSVPITNRQSGVTSADLVLPMEPRTGLPRTTLGGGWKQTAVAPGLARLGRHNIIVTHSTSYSQITSHSHTSHSALQQTPHNTK